MECYKLVIQVKFGRTKNSSLNRARNKENKNYFSSRICHHYWIGQSRYHRMDQSFVRRRSFSFDQLCEHAFSIGSETLEKDLQSEKSEKFILKLSSNILREGATTKPMKGIEPLTTRLRIECSTPELHRHQKEL